MKYRTLGRSGAVVSAFALGTMTFGSETGPAEAHAQLDRFADAGGTLVETADVYSAGRSEEIVGEWLHALPSARRDRVFLAGKGRFPVGVDARDAGLSRRHLRRALDASLTRLRTDHLDLYQVHSWDPVTPLEETLGFLEDAVRAGKIGYACLSIFIGWQIAWAAALAGNRFPLVSMQPQYNLLAREVEWEILPACSASGLGVLPWSPLAGGWLTGKYSRDSRPQGATRLGENPERGVEAYALRSRDARTWAVLEALDAVAARRGSTPGRVALAWLLHQDAVSSVILGARSVAQLDDNLAASEITLSPADLDELAAASDPRPAPWPYGAAGVEQRSRDIG
jgi:aryl-alcohol dehydrogenase-like predicted oxidoreductase